MPEKTLITSIVISFLMLFFIKLFSPMQLHSEEADSSLSPPISLSTSLVQAVMCEGIKDHAPLNETIIFSVTRGQAICYTSFDPVIEETFIYHKWFQRDKFVTKIKLTLKPPRWSTFSRIYIRNDDKGPWRVEITDPEENILRILRFSITD